METRKQLSVAYYGDKDILYLHILPKRPFVVSETDLGFFIHYDMENQESIVGFECLDFSMLVPHIEDSKIVPDISISFDVKEFGLEGVSLKKILEWAYRKYVLKLEIFRIAA